MAVILEITSAPDPTVVGKKFPVRSGLTLGRKRGDILLKDQKASSLHGLVEIEADGELVLRDQNSSNGTWVDGKKVDKVILVAGAKFQIGDYYFQVLVYTDEEIASLGLDFKDWRTGILDSLNGFHTENHEGHRTFSAQAFHKPLRLTFTHGPFMDQFITFGFGPRLLGYNIFDEEILDPQLPQYICEFIPEDSFVTIRNICGSQLFLNDSNFESEQLKDGDVLKISTHQMKVSYII